jgi:hypothetical protein
MAQLSLTLNNYVFQITQQLTKAMKILIYADIENKAGYQLEEQIWDALHQVKVSLFVHSVSGLFNEVCHPMGGFSVLIFFPNDKESLRAVLKDEQSLKDLKKIIVLPNDDQEFESLAMQLQPSLMCHVGSSSDHVLSMLSEMTVHA